MSSTIAVEKIIGNITEERIDRKNKITPGRLNEVFELLKIPYEASSHAISKGQRVYELKNSKGEVAAFKSMKEMLFDTPLGKAIRKRIKGHTKPQAAFFADLEEATKRKKA